MIPDNILSFDNPVLRGYAFYSAVLVFKMFAVGLYTALNRVMKRVFISPEDVHNFLFKKGVCRYDHPYIERIRRAHMNDLENIPLFFVMGLLYVLTDPCPVLAINLFRAFTAARIAHSIVYILAVPQPARAISFFVGVGATAFMALQVALRSL